MSKAKPDPSFPLAHHDHYATNGLARGETDLSDFGPSLTRQEFSEECDINVIMAQYEKTGVISHVNQREPMYVDYTMIPDDLMGTMAQLKLGEEAFMSLPASVRKEFDNNALNFVEFASDPENLDQMREWGLAPPVKAPDAPVKVEIVGTPPASPEASTASPEAATQ